MTDKIIKALECCKISDCPNCPYIFNGCIKTLHENIIDTIINQQAEIERLECSAKDWEETARQLFISRENIKAEAVKEFAERFFKTLRKKGLKGYMFNFSFYYADDVEDSIKEVTKEMVGEG